MSPGFDLECSWEELSQPLDGSQTEVQLINVMLCEIRDGSVRIQPHQTVHGGQFTQKDLDQSGLA